MLGTTTCYKTIIAVGFLIAQCLAATCGCKGDTSEPADASVGMGGAGSSSAPSAIPTPDGGGVGSAGMGGAGSTGAPATFTAVYDMMFPITTKIRCNGCHGMPADDLMNGNLAVGLDKVTAYAALVGKKSMSSRCMNMPLVVAGQPDMSLLLLKLSNPPCGARMPFGGKPLSDDQLEMVRSWIAAGAKDN